MTDLHVHILPGVDDGSPNLSTSLEMAEMAAQSGVRILAVTPHANQTGIEGVEDGYVNYESEQLEEQFYRLEREINREHIPISLVRGMEIMSIGPLEKKIRERKLIPLHESRYYLIEVPFDMAPDGIRKRLLEFPAMGKIPVLAHPERLEMLETPGSAEGLLDQGAVLQVTADCLTGPNTPARRRAVEWTKRGWVKAVATDAHDAARRVPRLSAARRWLEDQFGEAAARALTLGNPEKILRGEPL